MNLKQTYKNLSDQELLRICSEAHKYSKEAIKIALQELDSRTLNKQTRVVLEQKLIRNKNKKAATAQKQHAFQANIKKHLNTGFHFLHPIKKNPVSGQALITYLVLVFGCIALIQLVAEVRHYFFLYRINESFGIYELKRLFGVLILIAGLVLLYKRKKAGWMLLCSYLIFNICIYLKFIPIAYIQGLSPDTSLPIMPITINLNSVMFQVLLHTLAVLSLARKNVLNTVRIHPKVAWSLIGIGLIVCYTYLR